VFAMIEDIWNSMEKDSICDTESFILKRRLNPDSPFDLFLALEKPGNRRMLLLSTSLSNVPDTSSFPQSKGFKIQVVSIPEDTDNHINLELLLTDSRYSDIFSILVNDIIDHIDEEIDEVLMIKSFIERLIKWQQFLERYGDEGLGEKAQRGLYGELWFLKKYMIPLLGISEGIDSWKGPSGSAQDFQYSNCAVEVKTTVSKQHQTISISNEHQLDDQGLYKLFLQYISLIESKSNGETLSTIVEDIRKLISSNPVSSRKMDELLIKAGYLKIHADRYNRKSYMIRSSNIFEIQEGFPRIIGSDLRNGVGDVHYSISVAECMHYAIDESEFMSFLREINGC